MSDDSRQCCKPCFFFFFLNRSSGSECTQDVQVFYFRGLIITADARESNETADHRQVPHLTDLSRLDRLRCPYDTEAIKQAADSVKPTAMNGSNFQQVGTACDSGSVASASESCRTERCEDSSLVCACLCNPQWAEETVNVQISSLSASAPLALSLI